ncbi:hypothetical protein AA0111_g11877 [Alternaria arborescens]|uniref:hypothetical protein n=1 Tax=Alternaria arborescens TaxID=156630 RepID=UPI001075157A|nr:hypothetical protein AA0111_g11877 [Alternaria arborescens]RYO14812.1 hypothetical protein AA0111_g11877 [Alternaria arborescens]
MKVPSTSLEGLSVAGASRLEPLGVSQEIHVESFSSSRLRELAKAYIEDVHVLHPMFEEPWKMCEEFIENYSDSAATTGSIMSSLKNAIVLLLLALGSCKPISDGTKHSGVLPGIVYYSYAQIILASKRKKYDISVAQAMTLAALYENQIGMLQKSYASVSYAYHIYTDLCNHARFSGDASAVQKQNTSFSEETKRSFWICQDLARGINTCLSIVSADPVRTSGCDMFPGESPEEGPAMVLATRALLRKTFDEVQKLAPTENTATGRIDEDDLEHLMSFANSQLEFLEYWRSVLPSQLAWEDKELPSTDPLMASLRAEYYNNRVKLLRPYLGIIRNCECFNVAVDRPSAGQRKLSGVALDWVNSALSSIIAFDRIGTSYDGTYETYRTTSRSSVMLSNPVETLHTQVTSPVKCFFRD